MGLSSVQPANAATVDSSETLTVDNATSNGVSAQEIAAADSIVIGDQEFDAVDRRETRQDVARSIETRTVAGEQPQVNPYGVFGWIRKGVSYVLKHQKHRLPKKVQPWADKIIVALDYVEVWEMASIQLALIQQGVPADVAYDFAYWVVFVFGV